MSCDRPLLTPADRSNGHGSARMACGLNPNPCHLKAARSSRRRPIDGNDWRWSQGQCAPVPAVVGHCHAFR